MRFGLKMLTKCKKYSFRSFRQRILILLRNSSKQVRPPMKEVLEATGLATDGPTPKQPDHSKSIDETSSSDKPLTKEILDGLVY